MPFLFSALILLTGAAPSFAQTSTVLELQRTNYKPEKLLVYDLSYDSSSCTIHRRTAFDTYYRDNKTGRRLDQFSSDSKRYFGPRTDLPVYETEAPLSFLALEEIQKELGERVQLTARLEKVDGRCVASSEITYRKQRYTLEKIFIKMKKVFGFPAGVESVILTGRNPDGSKVRDCVVGC